MKYKNKGFTLIELTISMLILSIIIIGISISLMKVSDSLGDTTLKSNIFSDIKEFIYDSYAFNYNSGKILTGSLLLYDDNQGIIIGEFLDENSGFNYKINPDDTIYNKVYFGYFSIDETTLSGILNNSINVLDLQFNKGKIFKNILIKDFLVSSYNSGTLFEIGMNVFKKFQSDYYLKEKSSIFLPTDKYLKFNFNF